MNIISLSPAMNNRLLFDHVLLDQADNYKKPTDECVTRDDYILGHMWVVRDLVSRFRSHFPETRRMTDDMASVGLEALTFFVSEGRPFDYNSVQAFIHGRIRDFINDNRSVFSASTRTNRRREENSEPMEYHFAIPIYEDITGEDDYSTSYVDILDAVESLAETDKEHMHTLIMAALNRNHDIDEATLTEDERAAIVRLSEIGRDLL